MSEKTIKSKIISGLLWKFMERGGTQAIQFIISLVLARLLTPDAYGIVGLITVFISIATVFVISGFGNALVQKKDVDDEDYSSVFYLSLGVAMLFYIVLFFTAPLIAMFYKEPILIPIVRVQAITLLFGAVNSIQNSVLTRNMQFKKSFYRNIGAVIISGVVGILFALAGFGVWALVYSSLTNSIAATIILWFTVDWRPKLLFSFEKLKALFNFGSKLLCSSLLECVYSNLYPLIIGKIFTKDMLGFYNRGQQIPMMMVENINGSISGVMFPALSENQDNRQRVKEMVRRSIVTSSFLLFPAMIGLAAVAKPLTIILLTEKWLPSVPFMQLSCIALMFMPIHTANLQAINAMGRSDIFLKLEIIKKILGITVICFSVQYGIYAMILGQVAIAFISTIINAYPNKKLLNYSFLEQYKDIMPSLILAVVMGVIVLSIQWLNMGMWVTLLLQVLFGSAFYVLTSYLFKLESLTYLLKSVNLFKK